MSKLSNNETEPVLPEHQERVVLEKEGLEARIDRLSNFLVSDAAGSLSGAERERLKRQHACMRMYLDVLNERLQHAYDELGIRPATEERVSNE